MLIDAGGSGAPAVGGVPSYKGDVEAHRVATCIARPEIHSKLRWT